MLFRKLTKFRGKDFGKSRFEIDNQVNKIEFPADTTLRLIFSGQGAEDEKQTAFGEIIYMRSSAIDFSTKSKEPG